MMGEEEEEGEEEEVEGYEDDDYYGDYGSFYFYDQVQQLFTKWKVFLHFKFETTYF